MQAHALPLAVRERPRLSPDAGRDARTPDIVEHPCSPDGDDILLRQTAPARRLGRQLSDPAGVAEQIR